jgi:hypothetical protein
MATLSIQQAVRGFGCSTQALLNWRRGTGTKKPLPVHTTQRGEKGHGVFLKPHEVQAWAKKHGKTFDLDAALKAGEDTDKPAPKTDKVDRKKAPKAVAKKVTPAKAPAAKKAATKSVATKKAAGKAATKVSAAPKKPKKAVDAAPVEKTDTGGSSQDPSTL